MISLEVQNSNSPKVIDISDCFDTSSGGRLERIVFNNRKLWVALCVLTTIVLMILGAKNLVVNAGFEDMLPRSHPYVQNYFEHKEDLRGLGNSVRIVVENTKGDIFDADYLEVLRKVSDEIYLTPGVDRAWMKSIWTPSVRWNEVTEEGFRGGQVMPESYNGSKESIDQLRVNIARAGLVGNLISANFRSSMIVVPLLDKDPKTGKRFDYESFSNVLENNIRTKYEFSNALKTTVQSAETSHVKIHVIGFAKLVGELIDGVVLVMLYFGLAALIAFVILYLYTRCIRSTVLVLACSTIAVVWQLGVVNLLGFDLDPFSILVPFLVFAIGVSHGAQKMNGIMQDVARGADKAEAARLTFRRLFVAGLTALLADAVGFSVLYVIDIPVIRNLALTASIGVALLVFTNLLLLPILISFFGVSPAAAARSLRIDDEERHGKGFGDGIWRLLNRFTERRWANAVIIFSAAVAVGGYVVSQGLQIGDLDSGAPELRANSRYNQDNKYITENYSLSSDQFAVIVKTAKEGCLKYETLIEADRLGQTLRQIPGVQTTTSLADSVRQITAGSFEGSMKWLTLSRNQDVLNYGAQQAYVNNPDLFNTDCSVMPVIAYLTDHRADTLKRVEEAVEEFAKQHNSQDVQFLLAAGTAGFEAATNRVVEKANSQIMIFVYLAVIVLCLITFRNIKAVFVAVIPLAITSILCEALMVVLGIGVKVSTLPVIALGVGIGVDYALYLLSVQLAAQRRGLSLNDAYREAVQFTGRVVALIGITLAAGVITWVFSPIKFQADMGILLSFMFIWNMFGALVLIPALSHYLLNPRKAEVY